MSNLKQRFRQAWTRLSRIGLRDEESVIEFREVILLNRLMGLMVIMMLIYIPVEIIVNGWQMVPAVFIMMVCELITLVFHRFRLFRAAKYYLYFFTTGFVMLMGLMVGQEIQNYVIFIPIVIVATILFKTNTERITFFILTVLAYLLQRYLFNVVPPQIETAEEVKPMFATIFFILGMAITFLSGYYFIGLNKEFEGIIVQQKEKLETKNKEVTDSITYARRIQAAILPSHELFKQHLPESFILYKPKDIVAGDFYWMDSVSNEVLFAAADCTGHGVPGAMVSVICYNALNRSVRENNLTDPAQILDSATSIVVSEFGKSHEDVNDGMDISLCALNAKTKQLRWAGANNPLWLIRNGEFMEWKANKQPVGKHSVTKPFTIHSIQLQPNDTLYIFTDGFYDQFGGERGKKFKASRLRELILKIHSKPMIEQLDELERTFDKWKGDLEQVDDVCLIGFRC
jgi:serine phosphatase RsbU (regulator of sigma subunit)